MAAPTQPGGRNMYRYRLALGLSLFVLFTAFYLWAAVVNTPGFKDFAAIPVMGMPLGMFISLAIFPLSIALVFIYYFTWK